MMLLSWQHCLKSFWAIDDPAGSTCFTQIGQVFFCRVRNLADLLYQDQKLKSRPIVKKTEWDCARGSVNSSRIW